MMGFPVLEIDTSCIPRLRSNWPLCVFGNLMTARKPLEAGEAKRFCMTVRRTTQIIFLGGESLMVSILRREGREG